MSINFKYLNLIPLIPSNSFGKFTHPERVNNEGQVPRVKTIAKVTVFILNTPGHLINGLASAGFWVGRNVYKMCFSNEAGVGKNKNDRFPQAACKKSGIHLENAPDLNNIIDKNLSDASTDQTSNISSNQNPGLIDQETPIKSPIEPALVDPEIPPTESISSKDFAEKIPKEIHVEILQYLSLSKDRKNAREIISLWNKLFRNESKLLKLEFNSQLKEGKALFNFSLNQLSKLWNEMKQDSNRLRYVLVCAILDKVGNIKIKEKVYPLIPQKNILEMLDVITDWVPSFELPNNREWGHRLEGYGRAINYILNMSRLISIAEESADFLRFESLFKQKLLNHFTTLKNRQKPENSKEILSAFFLLLCEGEHSFLLYDALLQVGADFRLTLKIDTKYVKPPFFYLNYVEESRLEKWIDFLMARGADLNAPSDTGSTPCWELIQTHLSVECLEVLLKKGVQVNASINLDPQSSIEEERRATTLLHAISLRNWRSFPRGIRDRSEWENINIEYAKILIKYGANPSQINLQGETPAVFAREQKYERLAQYLEHMAAAQTSKEEVSNNNSTL